MKKILPCLLLSLPLQAGEPVFMRVLEQLNQDGILPAAERSCSERSNSASQAQECAVKLCGKPSEAKTAYITDQNIPEVTDPELLRQVQALDGDIEKAMGVQLARSRKYAGALKAQLAKGGFTLSVTDFVDEDFEAMGQKLTETMLMPDVDYAKPFEKRLSFKKFLPPGLTRAEVAAIDDYALASVVAMTSNFSDACYSEIYTFDEAKPKLVAMLASFDESLAEARKTKPDFLRDQEAEIEQLRTEIRDLQGGTFEVGNKYNLLAYYDGLLMTQLGREPRLVSSAPPKCATATCRSGMLSLAQRQDWQGMLTGLESELNDPLASERMRAFCRSNSAAVALKQSEVETFLTKLPEIRQRFEKQVLARFSDHSRQAFNAFIDNELYLNFKQDTQTLEDYKARIEQASQEDSEDLASPKQLLLGLLSKRDPLRGTFPAAGELDCAQSLGATAWDAFTPEPQEGVGEGNETKQNIFISFFSCSHPNMGEQVFAHELGHALSQAFKDNKLSEHSFVEFMKDRKCMTALTGLSTFQAAMSDLSHPGDHYRTEEDTADLVAYRYGQGNAELMSCALLEPTYDTSSYDSPSLINSISLDPHSSALTRTVREALHKGIPLPSACEALIQSQTEQRFTSCL